jgi:hypothetical protein
VREYTYVYGAVCPFDGTSCYLILPDMNGRCMSLFLRELARRNADSYLLVVCDGAPCHSEGAMDVPEEMALLKLPPYSPNLNPTENNWDDCREKFFGNVVFDSMDAVEDRLMEACRFYLQNPDVVRSFAGWDWIVSG